MLIKRQINIVLIEFKIPSYPIPPPANNKHWRTAGMFCGKAKIRGIPKPLLLQPSSSQVSQMVWFFDQMANWKPKTAWSRLDLIKKLLDTPASPSTSQSNLLIPLQLTNCYISVHCEAPLIFHKFYSYVDLVVVRWHSGVLPLFASTFELPT